MSWMFLSGGQVRADGIMFAYEADALPIDSDWDIANPCTPPCIEQIVDGNLVLEWPAGTADIVNYNRDVSNPPELPPATFWMECRFKSLLPRPMSGLGCDGTVSVRYLDQTRSVFLHGDGAEAPSGVGFIFGLPVDTFRTYRFESEDASSFVYLIDGAFLYGGTEAGLDDAPAVQFGGLGQCTVDSVERNTWDYVRFGTIAKGELIIASDPPSGVISSLQYPSLDRFTVTFDAPNYVKVSEITVSTTGGPVLTVLQTRRNDNFATNTVEIVLDQPLTVGETTTFTFDDGVAINIVEYSVEPGGACCRAAGTCEDATASTCSGSGDVFVVDVMCQAPKACCFSDGTCKVLDPTCCTAIGGTPQVAIACEGDADNDGIDGRCGDGCPNDPDNDIDGDGICGDVDDCPLLNPNDADNDGTPDCLEDPAIPTVSAWGLIVLALVLAVAGKVLFAHSRRSTASRGSFWCV